MGRIVVPVSLRNPLEAGKEMRFDALVDTGASGLVLPAAWKDRLSPFGKSRPVKLETADQRVIDGEVCGPVEVQIEGFDPVFNEVTFVEAAPEDGGYEPLLGYILLEQSRAVADPVGHRLLPVKAFDLKRASGSGVSAHGRRR
jgi:predicted aspartyl protease